MRTADDIIRDYRARGYSDERLRALANGRPEPVRSEMLELLAGSAEESAVPCEAAEDVLAKVADPVVGSEPLPADEEEIILIVDPDTAPAAATEDEEVASASVSPDTGVADPVAHEQASAAEPEPSEVEFADVLAEVTGEVSEAESAETDEEMSAEAAAEDIVADAEKAEPLALEFEEDEAAQTEEADEPGALDALIAKLEAETDAAQALVEQMAPEAAANLAAVEVEHLTPEEYFERRGTPLDFASDVIDLRSGEAVEAGNSGVDEIQEIEEIGVSAMEVAVDAEMEVTERTEDPVDEAVAEAIPAGEHWPSPAAVEAASAEPDLFAKIDSDVFIVFQEDSEQTVDSIKANRAAQRSLRVLQDALREDPELISAAEAGATGNIIQLNPPYAIASDEEAFFPQAGDIPVEKDESGLIRFPAAMLESYQVIAEVRRNAEELGDEQDEVAAPVVFEATQAELFAEPAPDAAAEAIIVPGEGACEVDAEAESLVEEIAVLRNWLTELEDALKLKKIEGEELARLLGQRDETLRMQSEEIERLRETLHADEARLHEVKLASEKLDTAQAELEGLRQEMAALEREYNILSTSTVPDLMQDKEDLVEMLETEAAKHQPLSRALHESGRRVAVGYTLAAAASVLMVLSLVFHWIQGDTRRLEQENLLAEMKQDLIHAKEQTAALEQQKEKIQGEWTQRLKALERKNTALVSDLAKARSKAQAQEVMIAELRQNANRTPGPALRTPEDVRQDNDRALSDGSTRQELGGVRPRNEVRGIRVQPQPRATAGITTKKATVRQGEGISHVLWRELGSSSSELVEWVVKQNRIEKHPRGFYLIRPGQELMIPASMDAVGAIATQSGNRPN